jgi:TetR/AcrR family transcriptional repressor of nem operon
MMGRTSNARDQLVDSAITLIHARSYAAVSVDNLCAHAGVNKGSFYHFFPSKRDLALAVIERQWAHAQQLILDPAFAHDVPPLERIRRLFRCAATLQRSGDPAAGPVLGCPFGNLAAELGTQDPVIRDKVQAVFAGYQAAFERVLRAAQEAGEMDPVDVPAAARSLLALFEGALLLAKTYNNAALIEQVGQHAISLIGHGGGLSASTAVGAASITGRSDGGHRAVGNGRAGQDNASVAAGSPATNGGRNP